MAVGILWLALPPLLWGIISCFGEEALRSAGLIGDAFGSVNALFSGLALGGVAFAVYLQARQLDTQKAELRLAQDQSKNVDAVAQEQVRLMRISSLVAAIPALIEQEQNVLRSAIQSHLNPDYRLTTFSLSYLQNILGRAKPLSELSREEFESRKAIDRQSVVEFELYDDFLDYHRTASESAETLIRLNLQLRALHADLTSLTNL